MVGATGCALQRQQAVGAKRTVEASAAKMEMGPLDDHSMHMVAAPDPGASAANGGRQGVAGIPADNNAAAERLKASPRKGQFVALPYEAGSKDSLMVWVSYPQAGAKAPVVIVIHDNQGLSTWARAVADQLAADGFVAIAPDLISRVRGGASSAELSGDSVRKLIGGVTRADRQLGVLAAANFGMSLPVAEKRYGVVGFCWGGGESFFHAVYSSKLGAAVVYYGTPPVADSLAKIGAPVLGLYGGTDARISSTVPGTDSAMKSMHKRYEYKIFDGAGHGFMRSQDPAPNLEAAKQAWPMTVAFFRKNLGA
jgi:carboxymethylenebutenolidase